MIESSVINLDHGDGGAATLRFINQEILTRFGNPVLDVLEDGARIPWNTSHVVISTDSYIVDPPVFPGGNIGRLAISGTVNDLVAAGAVPFFFTLSLILTEGFPFTTLRSILESARQTAESAAIYVVAGDTKVLPSTTGHGIYINTTGLGCPVRVDRDYAVSGACPGDNIVVTGSVGDHGFAVLSAREGLGFERRVVSDCAPLNELMCPILGTYEGIRCLRDPTRGGLIGVLTDIAEMSKSDIFVDEKMIPVNKEVRFGCEMLGLDPLLLPSEGRLVIVVAPEQTNEVINQLRRHPLGRGSEIIGMIGGTVSPSGLVYLRKENSERVLIRPEGRSLPRLC
jgi:hydrogenase expression/formation protein HypE